MNKMLCDLVEDLILARLLVTTEKKAERGRIRSAIEKLVGHRLSASEWKSTFDGCLDRLCQASAITLKPLAIQETGRQRAMSFLGIPACPSKLSWATIKKRYLTAKALGIEAPDHDSRKRLEQADGLRAAILATKHRLPIEDCPTVARAAEALAWRQLGVETDRPFSKREVLALLLYRAMGADPSARGAVASSPDVAARNQAVLRAIGAKSASAAQLHDTTIRHWIDTVVSSSAPSQSDESRPSGQSEAASEPQAAEEGLAGFARQVVDAATSCRAGRFGDHKVFISHVWKKLRGDSTFSTLDFPRFQERLTEAHRLGLLHLSQADLVEAMDPNDVAESETPYMNMTFHFIRI